MDKSEKLSKEEYNDIPVYYCSFCGSLHIRACDTIDYCEDCGCVDIKTCHINEWQEKFQNNK